MAKKYYAVKTGKQAGIYTSWDQCKAQVHGYPGALYKSFPSLKEANLYMEDRRKMKSIEANDDQYRIFVDGSYYNKAYSWGYAVYKGNRLIHTASGAGENAEAVKIHNVAGELEATIKAVEWACCQGIKPVTILHDYIGISEWAENRWKTNNEITKAYAAFMQEYLSWVHFQKVAGHTGVEGNELADQLAKSALTVK